MYESEDIVKYLREDVRRAGARRSGWARCPRSAAALAAGARMATGRPRASRAPDAAPGAVELRGARYRRLVREVLCELELPYVLHNVAKGSPRREAFVMRSGKMMVPYLADPNTGRELFESADIVSYLRETYQTPTG